MYLSNNAMQVTPFIGVLIRQSEGNPLQVSVQCVQCNMVHAVLMILSPGGSPVLSFDAGCDSNFHEVTPRRVPSHLVVLVLDTHRHPVRRDSDYLPITMSK